MASRLASVYAFLILCTAGFCPGAGLWDPQSPGTVMTDNVYNVDGTHRVVTWASHAGYVMAVDAAGVYDNWRTVDDAPQVRISFDDTSVDLRNRDFVITARTHLRPGYGEKFHAGLCVAFSDNLLVWGPHGSTDLRFRRPDGVDLWQSYPSTTVFLKITRHVEQYSAWYSSDGKNWELAGTTTIATPPVAAGSILKTWSVPHAETVDFDYLELTNVQDEPPYYLVTTRSGLMGKIMRSSVPAMSAGATPDPSRANKLFDQKLPGENGHRLAAQYDAIPGRPYL